MALPTIAIPKYPITIPSSKKKIVFRPFLMKEQKILHMAMETNDQRQIFDAVCDIIRDCVDGVENPENLPMFDLEYIFMKIRAKSVGEIVEVGAKCPHCGVKNDVEINLDTIEVKFPENTSNKIMLDEKLGVLMRYPAFKDSLKDLTNLNTDGIFNYVCDSIEMVFDDSNTYTRKDFTAQELKDFVESMNSNQFEKLANFYTKLPELSKQVECTCIKCRESFKVDFKGLSDFFT